MDRILELVIVRLEQGNGLGVGHMAEVGRHDVVQALQQALIHELVEEAHLLRSVFQHIGDDILDHILGKAHIVAQVGKCDLRLDHPELSCMTGGIGIFRTESRSKGVDIFECHGVSLTV